MPRKMTRKQREVEKSKKEVQIVQEKLLDEVDYDAIAKQIFHNRYCIMLRTYTQAAYLYAVNYKNQWFFINYNRNTYKVISDCPMDILTDAEKIKFMTFKKRTEDKLQAEAQAKEERDAAVRV